MQWENYDTIKEQALEQARFLIENQSRSSQPYRNRFDHTLRVLKWAERIHSVEGGDIEIITLAVIFHDTGWDEQVDHALLGADLAEKFLLGAGVDQSIVARAVSAVQTHNKRTMPVDSLPIENLIVMDADYLDEKGVTTLVWDALATACEDRPGYLRVLEKDGVYFSRAKENCTLLRTGTGMKLYRERMAMWQDCLSHFRYELGLSDGFDA
jgi:uncharacterized protein